MPGKAHALKRAAVTTLFLAAVVVIALSGRAAAQTCGYCVAGDNTESGQNGLPSGTSGIDNSAFGDGALFNCTSGNVNTAVGVNALLNNNADQNTAVGVDALESNTTGF